MQEIRQEWGSTDASLNDLVKALETILERAGMHVVYVSEDMTFRWSRAAASQWAQYHA